MQGCRWRGARDGKHRIVAFELECSTGLRSFGEGDVAGWRRDACFEGNAKTTKVLRDGGA